MANTALRHASFQPVIMITSLSCTSEFADLVVSDFLSGEAVTFIASAPHTTVGIFSLCGRGCSLWMCKLFGVCGCRAH